MDQRAARSFEFWITVAIIGLLVAVLLKYLESSQVQVEDAAMQLEVSTLRSELLEGQAHREVFGGALPASRNPVDWTGRAPPNYLGALDAAPVTGGVWYFDTRGEVLVYRYRSGREARFGLVRGEQNTGVPGVLGGVGLRRQEDRPSAEIPEPTPFRETSRP